jgi:general secretion pathway protein I
MICVVARIPSSGKRRAQGFTLVEVLVALMIVALGLAALMVAVSGTARTSGFLRDKTIAQWIALNRLSEVRLNVTKFGQNTDVGEVDFANRKWHYDTRYFETSIGSMRRVVVRVYAGDAKTKGNPVAQAIGFLGTSLGAPGFSNVDWTAGTTATTPAQAAPSNNSPTPGVNPSANPPTVTPTTPVTPVTQPP